MCNWANQIVGPQATRNLYERKITGALLSGVVSSDQLMSLCGLASAPAMVLYRSVTAQVAKDIELEATITGAKNPLIKRYERRAAKLNEGPRFDRGEKRAMAQAIGRNKHWANDFMEM